MQEPELFLVFIKPLNKIEVPYMVTGSMAAMMYGEPRLTHEGLKIQMIKYQN